MILPLLVTGFLAVAPHASHPSLSFANGHSAAVVEADTGTLTTLLPHAYAEKSAGVLTPDLAYDLYAGLSIDGGPGLWLGKEEAEHVAYVPATGVVQVVHRKSDVKVETFFFAPWSLNVPSLAMVLRATNEGTETRTVVLAGLSNLHLGDSGGSPSSAGETMVRVDATHYEETGDGGPWAATYRVTPTPTTWAGTETNPFQRFQETGDLVFMDPFTGSGDDRVLGVARGPLPLDPGEHAAMAIIVGLEEKTVSGAPLGKVAGIVEAWLQGRSPEELVDDEIAGWEARLQGDTYETSDGDEWAVWRQGLALMRMAQVRELPVGASRPTGQILASLPPGQWNRTWPRDMSYAIAALARTGFQDAAYDALSFVLEAPGGAYVEEVGSDYLVSVCRYYGDGTEESDGDPDGVGPNIEFDGFGLFLWALGVWADGQEDLTPIAAHWSTLRERVADVIVSLVETDTGLMAADSSIWEVHWNGHQKHFTYTNAAAVAGLCAASRLAERLGDVEAQDLYGEVAQTIRDGVLTHLVDPDTGVLMGNLEEMAAGEALDSAAVEAINWGLIAPDDPIATATLAAFNDLRLGIERGYIRNDDGGWYDRQEWVFVNLRIATALRRMGRGAEADALVGWVVAQARENHFMIAELYTEVEADYAGAVPMAGYGAGALALATLESAPVMDVAGCISWETRIAPPEPEPDPDPDAGVEVTPDAAVGGEGDASGGGMDGVAISDVGGQSSSASARGGCSTAERRNRGGGSSEWLLLLLLALCLCPRGASRRARVRARTR